MFLNHSIKRKRNFQGIVVFGHEQKEQERQILSTSCFVPALPTIMILMDLGVRVLMHKAKAVI
jgi:hypothetical protein